MGCLSTPVHVRETLGATSCNGGAYRGKPGAGQGGYPAPVRTVLDVTAAMAAAVAASTSISDVSRITASAAAARGAVARWLSRRSRARISAARSHSQPHPVPSAGALARTSALAVTKSFTSASGQTTVPMSRPSSTAPGSRRAKPRWKSSSAALTSGMTATIEAAAPTASLRKSPSSKATDRARRPLRWRSRGHAGHGPPAARPAPPCGRASRCRGSDSRNAPRVPGQWCPCPPRPAHRRR